MRSGFSPPNGLSPSSNGLCYEQPGEHETRGKKTPTLTVLSGSAERLLNVRAVSERLGVHPSSVYSLCDRGELSHVRVSHALRI
jgi:hypothetical protein